MKPISSPGSEAGQIAASMVPRSEQALRNSEGLEDVQKVKEISHEFESIFVELMLGAMRKSVPQSGFINGGNAEDIYRGMLDSEYAKIIAKQDHGGLAAMIEKQLLQIMGKRQVGDEVKGLAAQGAKAYGLIPE